MGETHLPVVHGMPLQQFADVVQVCPYSEHAGPASGAPVVPPSPPVVPPSPPVVPPVVEPQVPTLDPGGVTQGSPAQQSAFVVHFPACVTHVPPHTKGAPPAVGFGTHGSPQQSAELAHALPACVPASPQLPTPVQRGMPRRSCWQTRGFWLTLPAQQLFSALQDVVASLHTAPLPRHALPLSQRPTASVGLALLHVTLPFPPGMFTEPQQSLSPRQISPVGRQPLGG